MAGDGSNNVGKNVGVFVGAARIFILVKYDLVNRDQVNRDQVFLNRESVARSALSLITAVQIFHREGLENFSVLCYNGYSKNPPRAGACGSCEVEENMEFGFRPQS